MIEPVVYEAPTVYVAPEIVFEGALEIQAGSPLGLPDELDFDDLEG